MTASTGILGYGCHVAHSPDGTTYTTPVEIFDITPPNIDTDDVDITNVDSANSFREFMAGLADAGEIDFKVIFTKGEASTMYGLHRTLLTWKVTYSDMGLTASTWVCQGYLKTIEGEIPLDDKVIQSFKVKLTGKPVFTPGT